MAQTRYLIIKYNPDIIAFMETRVYSNKAHIIIAKLNLLNVVEIPPEGFSRGIWLLWKNGVDFEIKVLKAHKLFIHHCQIRYNNMAVT